MTTIKPNLGKDTLFIRDIPKRLKRRFKAWCAANGITMHGKIVQMMTQTLKEKKE